MSRLHHLMNGIYAHELESVNRLTTSPEVLAKAIPTIKNPDVQVEDVVNLIRADVSLMAEVIRLSNSAYYGFSSEVVDLNEAISRIGFRELLRLVGVSVSSALHRKAKIPEGFPGGDNLREISLSAAVLMENLAERAGMDTADAYVIGLLHRVGLIVISQIVDKHPEIPAWNGEGTFDQWQREQLGFDSHEAGGRVLKRWHFPESVVETVMVQNEQPEQDEAEHMHLLIFTTRKVIERCGHDLANLEALQPNDFQDLLRGLELSPDMLESCVLSSREMIKRFCSSLINVINN